MGKRDRVNIVKGRMTNEIRILRANNTARFDGDLCLCRQTAVAVNIGLVSQVFFE